MYINNKLKGLISMNMEKNIQEVPIEDIIPNRFQPRLNFNEEGINELSESIKQHGIIQPLVVRKLGDKFEIIAGERRYKAATLAGLTKVPVIISDIDDNKSAEVALVENIQRRNLTAIEEAKSYKNLLDRGYLTQEQLANKMGVSQSSIANKLRLLNLDEEVQDALLNEKISERHARSLLALDNKEDQKAWLQKILDERLTVRQLDTQLKALKEKNPDEEESIPLVDINPNLDEIVNNAEDINVIREPHDVASMLIPEGGVKEEPQPVVTEPKLDNSKMPNKFFNFLEDEQANMSVIDPDEILNTFNMETAPIATPIETPKEEEKIDSIEILDDFDIKEPNIVENNGETIMNDTTENTIINQMPEQQPIESNEIFENQNIISDNNTIENNQISNEEIAPFKSIFFNNPDEEIIDVQTPDPMVSNKIEEVIPVQEEKLVDPIDSIVTLEPDYAAKQVEAAGMDLKTAINTIRDTINNLNSRGFNIELEEADLEDLYHITIKIQK